MSTDIPPRRHRHNQSAAMPPSTESLQTRYNPQNPQTPHHLNSQAHAKNSQTDMRSNSSFQQPTTPPRTPRNDSQPPSQNTSSSTAVEQGSKQRSRNKNRPKNVVTSPAAMRNTPPLIGAQSAGMPSSARAINTPSTAAYAGSTFHASPAPAALPIPTFYSKSVPDSPGVKGLKSLKGAALPTTPSVDEPQREESPLDFFFEADRKERARSSGSAQGLAAPNAPFSPPSESARNSQTPPSHSTRSGARQTSASGIFALELNGDRNSGTPFGPAFSTPYSERINAARSGAQLDGSSEQSLQHTQTSLDQSEALKPFLFSNPPPPAANSGPVYPLAERYQAPFPAPSGPRSAGIPNRSQNNGDPRKMNGFRTGGRSSGLRQEVTPTKTPTRTPDRNQAPTPSRILPHASSDGIGFATHFSAHAPARAPTFASNAEGSDSSIKGMEESLRRILKLDPAGSTESTIGQPASGANPNFVGGRAPQINGRHDGIM